MMASIFSKIIAGEIPAQIIHDDERCLAFHDIAGKAPVHVLVIPKKEIPRLALAQAEDEALLGHLLLVAAQMAEKLGLHDSGFRIVINNGPHGGETVPHLHVHLLGGRQLGWPPG
jgi:histidine triad (HIT) family protein